MAGTLTISTLSDGTNSTSATNCIQGSARAWTKFVGSSGTIAGSFNVSSITRSSAGAYTVNFTTAMPNTNYAACITVGTNSGGFGSEVAPITYNTTSLVVYSYDRFGNILADPTNVNIAIFSS
jgi:hypothetical protein